MKIATFAAKNFRHKFLRRDTGGGDTPLISHLYENSNIRGE